MNKKSSKIIGPGGKPIVVLSQDPVAKVLWKKTFREQVKPSKKEYSRKKEKLTTSQIIRES